MVNEEYLSIKLQEPDFETTRLASLPNSTTYLTWKAMSDLISPSENLNFRLGFEEHD